MTPTILILDSEPKLCTLLGQALTHEGYRVLTTTAEPEAVALVMDEQPQLVIAELRAYTTTGLRFLRRLRELDPQRTIRTILTAYEVDEETDTEARQLGLNDYLPRMRLLADLFPTVRRILTQPHTVPRWMGACLAAERHAIYVLQPGSGDFVLLNTSDVQRGTFPEQLTAQHGLVSWFRHHPQQPLLDLLALSTSEADSVLQTIFRRLGAELAVGMFVGRTLVGFVVLADRFWQMIYRSRSVLIPQAIHDQYVLQMMHHFVAERLEDNHVDLLNKVGLLLDGETTPGVVARATVPGVTTFTIPAQLARLQQRVASCLVHHEAHGYLYAKDQDVVPWPMAEVAIHLAFRYLVLYERRSPEEALEELEASAGVWFPQQTVKRLLRAYRMQLPAFAALANDERLSGGF
ncbi:MAG: response regulator [Candidatus Omnitrophica bacterium]|nr:response regulator [Candidatus Omnitrophota bacterium]